MSTGFDPTPGPRGVAIAPVVVGVQRVADRREQERAHRRRLSSSVAGRERPQRRRHHRELRVPHRIEDFVRRGGRGRERLVGSPISDANALGVDRRRSVSRRRLVSRLPDDVDDLGAVAVHAGLYQTRAVYHAVHDVVVVASEDEGQVELARRTLVLFFVEVAEREDQVCPFRLEQRFVPAAGAPGRAAAASRPAADQPAASSGVVAAASPRPRRDASARVRDPASVCQGSSIVAPLNAPGLGEVGVRSPTMAIFLAPRSIHACGNGS